MTNRIPVALGVILCPGAGAFAVAAGRQSRSVKGEMGVQSG